MRGCGSAKAPVCVRAGRSHAPSGRPRPVLLWLLRCACLLLCSICFSPGPVFAQEHLDEHKEALDAVLLLDSSGSMLLTDPKRLRDEGAKLFVQLLRPGDRLGIVEFSREAKVLRPLTPFDSNQTDLIGRQVSGVESKGAYTNLLAPLKKGEELLAENGRAEAEHVMILLSDGKMDPAPADGTPQAVTDDLLNNFLPGIKARGIKVYTLSLSEEADKQLLSDLAVRSGGLNWYTPSAETIHQSFAEMFLAVKKPQMLPLTNKGFRIDPEIQEATFYIGQEDAAEVALISPSGEKITAQNASGGVKWYKGSKFAVITISSPEAGRWAVEGLPKGEGFVAVLTNLKLETSWPTSIVAGSPTLLEARLYEAKKPVALPQMAGVVEYRFKVTPTDKVSEPIIRDILADNGTNGDKTANDGVFSKKVTIEEPGEYKLGLLAAGPTFERYQQLSFRVRPPLITLAVVSRDESALARRASTPEQEQHVAEEYFRAALSTELRGLTRLEVKLRATDKQGEEIVVPLVHVEDFFEAPVTALTKPGEYEVKAVFSGKERRGKHLQSESRPINYLKVPEKVKEHKTAPPPVRTGNEGPILAFLGCLVLISAAVGGAGYFGLKQLGKVQLDVSAEPTEQFEPTEPVEAAIALLEEKAAAVEIELNDTIFTDDKLMQAPVWQGSAPQAAPPEDEPAPDAEAPPEPVEAAEPGGEQ